MSHVANDTYLEERHAAAEQAIAEGNEEAVTAVINDLNENGYVFAAAMLQTQWDKSQEVDI